MQVTSAEDAQIPAPLLVRPEEAASMLRVSRTELFRMLGSGEISSLTIGRRRRIPVTALNEFVAAKIAAAAVGDAGHEASPGTTES